MIGANGEPAVFGAWTDVSASKPIEEALDGNHRELRALVDQKRLYDRLEALAEIGRAIRHADSAQDAANAVLGHVAHLVPCGLATVAVYDLPCLEATIMAVWSSYATRLRPGFAMPLVGFRHLEELLAGRVVSVFDFSLEPNPSAVESEFADEGFRACLIVPLRDNERTIGSLSIWAASERTFSPEEHDIAKELADGLAVAISNAQLVKDLRASNLRLSVTSRRLLDVQETERREIARELHDEIGQVVTGVKLRLGLAHQDADPATAEHIGDARQLIDELLTKVRRLSVNLRPPVLDALGLLSALTWHTDRVAAETDTRIHFEHAGLDGRFSFQAETAIYRIVQESLTNVIRHGGVVDVRVAVRAADGWLHVEVEDAGCGFDVAAAANGRSTAGLTGMEERVILLGGRFRIESSPGFGVRVIADIPAGV